MRKRDNNEFDYRFNTAFLREKEKKDSIDCKCCFSIKQHLQSIK